MYGISAYVSALVARQFGGWITNLSQQMGAVLVFFPLAPFLLHGAWPDATSVLLICGIGVLVMLANFASYQLLTVAPVALLWPIFASNGALISLLAIVFFGERVQVAQTAGLLMVLIGVIGTTYARPSNTTPIVNLGVLVAEPGRSQAALVPVAANPRTLLAATFVSLVAGVVVFFLIAFIKRYGWYMPVLIERTTQLTVALSLLLAGFPPRRHFLGHPARWWGLLPLIGVLDGIGLTMYGLGNQLGSTAITSIASSAFVVVPVLLGILIIGERPSRVQVMGISGVLVGLLLLAV